jgi:hypothetical protein
MIFVYNLRQSDKPYMTTSGQDYRRVKTRNAAKANRGKGAYTCNKVSWRGEDSSANLALKLANELEK